MPSRLQFSLILFSQLLNKNLYNSLALHDYHVFLCLWSGLSPVNHSGIAGTWHCSHPHRPAPGPGASGRGWRNCTTNMQKREQKYAENPRQIYILDIQKKCYLRAGSYKPFYTLLGLFLFVDYLYLKIWVSGLDRLFYKLPPHLPSIWFCVSSIPINLDWHIIAVGRLYSIPWWVQVYNFYKSLMIGLFAFEDNIHKWPPGKCRIPSANEEMQV